MNEVKRGEGEICHLPRGWFVGWIDVRSVTAGRQLRRHRHVGESSWGRPQVSEGDEIARAGSRSQTDIKGNLELKSFRFSSNGARFFGSNAAFLAHLFVQC